MDSLSLKLKNCFGINLLEKKFEFKKLHSVLIYAPNGTMKTSLTETLKQYKLGKDPFDRLHNLPASWEILADDKPLEKEEILIIEPFINEFEQKEFSSLLVDIESKKLYDSIISSIETQSKKIIANLNKNSGVPKTSIEMTLLEDFEKNNLIEVFESIGTSDSTPDDISAIRYTDIFNKDVEKLLGNHDFKNLLDQYQSRYARLLQENPIFNKGTFTPSNASSITSSLSKNNYFKAGHSIKFNGIETALDNEQSLQDLVHSQQKEILADPLLSSLHNDLVNGVNSVTKFQSLLVEHPEITHRLGDIKKFKQDLWESYFLTEKSALESLLNEFKGNKKQLTEIEAKAISQTADWESALDEFNSRFDVPYTVEIANLKSAVLGEETPNLVFKFSNGQGKEKILSRNDLEKAKFLSRGETRAFYLMNVLFEIKARIKNVQKTLIIADDIADSFDYRNKAAILEYLGDISQNPLFKLVVLTHNFDFYRTYRDRIMWSSGQKANCFVANKTDLEVEITCSDGQGIHKPFEHWKGQIEKGISYATIAMIGCVRNLIEYKTGFKDDKYKTLTSLLHDRDDSSTITFEMLEDIYSEVINLKIENPQDKQKYVQPNIFELSDEIAEEKGINPLDLSKKVVLSIGIRLKFEQTCKNLLDGPFNFTSNQTSALYRDLKKAYLANKNGITQDHIDIGRKVVLITPENIHLNSFMYEPLMDLPIENLVDLYKSVKNLKTIEKQALVA